MGCIVMIILGSGKLDNELCGKLVKNIDCNSPWKMFIEDLCESCDNILSELPEGYNSELPKNATVLEYAVVSDTVVEQRESDFSEGSLIGNISQELQRFSFAELKGFKPTKGREQCNIFSDASTIKLALEKIIWLLAAAWSGVGNEEHKLSRQVLRMLDELVQFYATLDGRQGKEAPLSWKRLRLYVYLAWMSEMGKVEKIPESFHSVEHYFGCYLYPLLEETRAQVHSSMEIIHRAPYAKVVSFENAKPYGRKLYNVKVDYWRNRFNDRGKEPYKTFPGDLFGLANAKPETVSDLQRVGRSWAFGSVTKVSENDDTTSLYFKVKASKELEVLKSTSPLFMVFLVNLIPNGRIWKALHMSKNLKIIKEVLCPDSEAQKSLFSEKNNDIVNMGLVQSLSSGLNESQTGTILACLEMLHSCEKSAVELIWGPPGTGTTKTIVTLLLTLLQMNCRTLVCANVAITEIASRLVKIVTEIESNALFCSLGKLLLFGNKERLKVGSGVEEIYLDYRLKRLVECLGPQTGWRHCFTCMIECLEDGVSHYHTFLKNGSTIEKEQKITGQMKVKESRIVTKVGKHKCKTFLEFIRDRFVSSASPPRYCISIFCTHMAKNHISLDIFSRGDFVQLSENRASNLTSQERKVLYDIFQMYEKMKMEYGEFDLSDFVTDLHRQLRHEMYEGDHMDFVYIDEFQDLTMSQIALFKPMCHNVEEGFVFSGDTAQTIAKGVDFRFQELQHLFYKKFLLESRSNKHDESKEKGQISEILHLTQNFCTHAGILKLSQSIVELLYHLFPFSIDVLKPESNLIYGEAPVLLQSGENEIALVKIFGNMGNIVGFGAEHVILVRDDSARNEISKLVGKHALVLTIIECKGLEFQEVLLYNFFGSSPSRNQWRVIYDYMKELDLLDHTLPRAFPSFNMAKQNILCSELKQLYVAVTCTRQRLWICVNFEELSKPMFDYWKKKCHVQVKQLDDSHAHAMQVASSPEEWKSRGMKLYHEHNYEMATMCFERAGDIYWERRSKAAGLKALADRMRSSNPEEARSVLREAAEIFDAIGKADSAARCFSDLGEYERAVFGAEHLSVHESNTEAELTKYFMGSCHGTTILWVRISPTELLVGVDSLKSQIHTANVSNNARKYDVLLSHNDGKFIKIFQDVYDPKIPNVYASLCGDVIRCWKMVDHVNIRRKEHYKKSQMPFTLAQVGRAAIQYFHEFPMDAEKKHKSTVFLCSWIPGKHAYTVYVVGDGLEKAVEMTESAFGSGSGSAPGLDRLMKPGARRDVNALVEDLMEAAVKDPYTGGFLRAYSLMRGGKCELVFEGSLFIELCRHNIVYENMLYNGKGMFVIIQETDEKILSPLDLEKHLQRFDTGACRDDIFWLCCPRGFMRSWVTPLTLLGYGWGFFLRHLKLCCWTFLIWGVLEALPSPSTSDLTGSRTSGGGKPLHWTSCLNIHQNSGSTHRHLKSSNVLLGSHFESCLTDYCLTLFRDPDSRDEPSATTLFYRAPECRDIRKPSTQQADIYSFVHEETEPVSSGDEASEEKLQELLNIAMACVSISPENRPTMRNVLSMLRDSRADAIVSSNGSSDHSPGKWSDTVQSFG
ncbi:hypothetical protein ACLB2K_036137 [Fragaria x ananassa]